VSLALVHGGSETHSGQLVHQFGSFVFVSNPEELLIDIYQLDMGVLALGTDKQIPMPTGDTTSADVFPTLW
jgi:hypothetical protein